MTDPVKRPAENSEAGYSVGAAPRSDEPRTKYAVFFTHGMGQPIPFQTIDQVATSLRGLDEKLGHTNPRPTGRTIKSGADWLNRIELRLGSPADAVEVHLYEGYWAPITEGRISARQVIGFLAGAGFNGLRHTTGKFRRWLFGKYPELPIPVRTVFFLIAALAAVASLVVMNAAIAVVVTASAVLGGRPEWLSANLFADLTTTFNLVVAVMAVFGISIGIAAFLRRRNWLGPARKGWSFVTLLLFVMALFIVILSGVGVLFLFYGHLRGVAGTVPVWHRALDSSIVLRFDQGFDTIALWLALALTALAAARWIWRMLVGLRRDLARGDGALATIAVALAFLALAALGVTLGAFFLDLFRENVPAGGALTERAIAWPLLIAASAYIRVILVQYVGDVAIYVMPYRLDAFNDLRREIKQRVYAAARAVYSQKEYDKVIVVGHSLGSVIAYDALNMLILEDQSIGTTATGKYLDVVNRTPLFLTFGSPLDKTAFVFAVQARGTSEAREALAGSVQPMIQDYALRPPRWINVWSPWDIISGPLDLYDLPRALHDLPERTLSQRVQNVRDRDATTLLIAHVEYWKNPLVVGTIYDEIRPSPSAPRP